MSKASTLIISAIFVFWKCKIAYHVSLFTGKIKILVFLLDYY